MAKWAGLVILLTIAAVWAFSLSFFLRYQYVFRGNGQGRTIAVCLRNHNVLFFDDPWVDDTEDGRPGWFIQKEEPSLVWMPCYFRGQGKLVIGIPLWIPFLVTGIAATALFWRGRRLPVGRCIACGYDLTGNVSAICPECGQQV